jgi:hypothetical protein
MVPAAEKLGLAKAHAYLHLAAAVVFPLGIAMVTLGNHSYEFLAIIGSLLFLVAMILFTIVVYRTSGSTAAA